MTPMEITVIRSKRRKKTIQTKYDNGNLWIYLPEGMTAKDEQKWIGKMIEKNKRWEQKKTYKESDKGLLQRAQYLNKKYFGGTLDFSIRFVANQNSRYGSCTSLDRSIRISEKVKTMPTWVQDYIIIHELAHLLHPNHSKKFWETVNKYRYTERARGYLIAVGAEKFEEETEQKDF